MWVVILEIRDEDVIIYFYQHISFNFNGDVQINLTNICCHILANVIPGKEKTLIRRMQWLI